MIRNLIHLVPACCGVVVSMPAPKVGDAGSIPIGTLTKFSISRFHGRNLLLSSHMGEEKTLPQFQQGSGPVTSYMHAYSGSGRHVIPLRIIIRNNNSSTAVHLHLDTGDWVSDLEQRNQRISLGPHGCELLVLELKTSFIARNFFKVFEKALFGEVTLQFPLLL